MITTAWNAHKPRVSVPMCSEATMEPATLAATALAVALPYLAALAKEGAKSVAGAAAKSVWEWVKGKLTSETGKEAVKDLEGGPADAANRMAVTSGVNLS